jgi:hypothetical protein
MKLPDGHSQGFMGAYPAAAPDQQREARPTDNRPTAGTMATSRSHGAPAGRRDADRVESGIQMQGSQVSFRNG